MLSISVAFIAVVMLRLNGGNAFVQVYQIGRPVVRSVSKHRIIKSNLRNQGSYPFHDELEHLDQYKKEFEAIFKSQSFSDNDVNDNSYSLLTSASRHRRCLEMNLLESLQHSNDAIEELMNLWISESCDANAAAALVAMEEECSDGMIIEQALLQDMVESFPTWAEPRVRLATLLFYKGKTSESYATALEAIKLKPWHFEIYSLLVMIALRQEDLGQAIRWARFGLPHLRDNVDENLKNKSRRKWVARALTQAREQWDKVERLTEAILQKKEQKMNSSRIKQPIGEVWQ